jgi:hypothetical protein
MRLRSLATFLVVAAIAIGCSNPATKRGVDVREFNTNVGLGVEPTLGAAPPNILVRKPIPRERLEPPTFETIPPFDVPTPIRADCPRAGDFDFPAEEAGVEPKEGVRPAEGSYRYYLSGEIITSGGPFEVSEFEERVITKVEDDSAAPEAYHFTVQQSQLLDDRRGFGKLETTYRVIPSGSFQSVPNPPAPAPAVSDTGRGVYLVSIRFQGLDEEGEPYETRFDPSSPLLLLPYPVVQGTEIDSSGTDPQTGNQVTIRGQIKSKKQVDACGERVDTWLIDAVETFRFSDPETFQTETIEADYDYGIAPQFGGTILYERVVAPREGPIITLEARVGKVPTAGKAS